MTKLTNDETNLMCIYGATCSREELIQALQNMQAYLEPDETDLLKMTDATIAKLNQLTDQEFTELNLIPDFDI